MGRCHRRSRASSGFTVIELVVGVALVSLLVVGIGLLTRTSGASTAAMMARATSTAQRQTLDARAGELIRVKPQLGDVSLATPVTLAFRKPMAPMATVCSYADGTLRVALPAAERSRLVAGDSIAVRVSNGTAAIGDDGYALAQVTNTASTGACRGVETITITLPSPPPNGHISTGATVRVWSTRRLDVQAAGAAGYQLVEAINGGQATVLYGPFENASVFSYLDGSGAATTAPADIRLVRARFVPLQENQRAVTAVRPEHLEWPLGADLGISSGIQAGDVPIAANPTPAAAPRCTTAGAPNYGSPTAACCAGPWTTSRTGACGYGYNTGGITYQQDLQADCTTWGTPYQTGNTCACTLAAYNESTTSCATYYGNANWSGSVTQRQGRNADCASYGTWYVAGSSCSCTLPASQTQSQSCTWGPPVTQVRYSDGATCTWGAWQDTGTCWTSPPCQFNASIQSSDPACPAPCQWDPSVPTGSSSCRAPTLTVIRQGACGDVTKSPVRGVTSFSARVTWNGPPGTITGYSWRPTGAGFMSGQGATTANYSAAWSATGVKSGLVTVYTNYGTLSGGANVTYVSGNCIV